MNSTETQAVVKHLKDLLLKGNAHVTFDDAIKGVPPKMRDAIPAGLPYSIWQVLEHLRLAQWDILDFSRNPKYRPMKWPAEYWPKETAPKNADAWNNSIRQVKSDLKEFVALVGKKDVDLYTPFPWGDGQSLLREALLIADHNSYHVGEIIVIRRLLGIWK